FLVVGAVLACYSGAHRAIFPDRAGERRKHLAMMVVSPPAAVRAHDTMGRELLADMNPLAAASVLLAPEPLRQFVLRVIADLEHPREPICPTVDELARATESWFRERQLSLSRDFATSQGLEPANLLVAPSAEDSDCHTYCPRCRTQYVVREGTCEACG